VWIQKSSQERCLHNFHQGKPSLKFGIHFLRIILNIFPEKFNKKILLKFVSNYFDMFRMVCDYTTLMNIGYILDQHRQPKGLPD